MPRFPEETIKRQEPITLDIGKIYPEVAEKYVSSEQESSRLEDALMTKDEFVNELPQRKVPLWYVDAYNHSLELMQPALAYLTAIPLAKYGYSLLGCLILLALFIRYRRRASEATPAGKRKRHRQKKSSTYYYLKKSAAENGSSISQDPFLEKLAYD